MEWFIEEEKRKEILATYAVRGNITRTAKDCDVKRHVARHVIRTAQKNGELDVYEQAVTEQVIASALDAAEAGLDTCSDRLQDDVWCQSFKGGDPSSSLQTAIVNTLKGVAAAKAKMDPRLGAEGRPIVNVYTTGKPHAEVSTEPAAPSEEPS